MLQTQYEASGGGTIYLRWSPKGGDTTGEYNYLTDSGFVQGFQYPSVDAEEDGPMVVSANIQTAAITQGTVAT